MPSQSTWGPCPAPSSPKMQVSSLTAQWTSPGWATQLQWTLTKIVTPQSLSCLSVASRSFQRQPSPGPRLTALPQPESDAPGDSLPISWSFQRIITRLVTRSRQHNTTQPRHQQGSWLKTMPAWPSSPTCLIRSSLSAVRLTGLRCLSSTARLRTPHTDHFQVPCASAGHVIVRSASLFLSSSSCPSSSRSSNADMVSAFTMSRNIQSHPLSSSTCRLFRFKTSIR